MGLKGHVGGEFTLALRGAVKADRTADIFVPVVAGRFGRRIASFGDGAAVELAGAMSGTDIGADDALQVDLHGPFAKTLVERRGRVDDELFVQVADTVAVEDRKAEALGDERALRGIRAGEPDHLQRGAFAERNDAGAGARIGSFPGHDMSFLRFSRSSDRPLAGPPSGAV